MLYFACRKGGIMSSEVIAYEGRLSNGVKYQIHQSSGFSNKCDIAINIAGVFVSIITISPKRNGNIEIIPMNLGRMTVDAPKEDFDKFILKDITVGKESADLLSDVITYQDDKKSQKK